LIAVKRWIFQCLFLAEKGGSWRSRAGDGRVRWSQVVGFYGGRGKFSVAPVSCLPAKKVMP
jgi:hypothetical protein